jgi:regulator of protease activity HflC (stomatin/prohibitin superfamily)
MEGNIVVIVFAAMAIVLAFSAIKVVPQGRQWTVERFGRYTRTLRPGISFLIPFVDRIGRRLSMMETVLQVPQQDVITKDNAIVTCDAVVFIQVIDAAKAAYEVENLNQAILNLSMTNLRTVVGSMELDETLSQRDAINARLLGVIDAATGAWGVKVLRIEIKDLTPPADINEAMARQMKAERIKRAEILTAEGDRAAAILRAEGAKQSAILEAEGRREAAFRDAEARERTAEAEAKATDVVSAAIRDGDVNAIRYFLGLKYVEAFGQLATSNQQRTVIIPADLSGIAGLVEGLRALNAQGEGAAGGPWTAPRPPTPAPR